MGPAGGRAGRLRCLAGLRADALQQRNVPFVFATGYDPEVIPERHRHVPLCEKPLDMLRVVETLVPNCTPSTSSTP